MLVEKFRLEQFLSEDNIKSIKTRFGFQNPEIIERFIMDFEILYHLRRHMPCIVNGGMAVPFNNADGKPKRLSEDIDLITPLAESEVRAVIAKVAHELEGRVAIREHIPKTPKKLPLITYYATYQSKAILGKPGRIKLDILHSSRFKIRLA